MFTEKRSSMLHGVLLIGLFSCAAFYIGSAQIFTELSFSPMIIGIILGMLYANSLRNNLPETWVPGIQFCSKKLLRLGIILYGFRLTFMDVVAVGLPGIIIDVIVVTVTVIGGYWLGKALKMDRDIALLTSIGSGICGAAAVLGAESTIQTKPYKTAVAVATVVIFGTISMFLYPIAYRAGILNLSPEEMGIYAGSTLHEVAHAVGAGNAMGPEISDVAVIVKMIRVMLLVPVLLILGYWTGCLCRKTRQCGQRHKRQSDNSMVCSRLSRSHRIQFIQLIAAVCCRHYQLHRHIPAHYGYGGPWCRNEHRQIQKSGSKAVYTCIHPFYMAHRRWMAAC